MGDLEITIKLPEDLIRRAEAAGIDLASAEPDIIEFIEQRVHRKESARRFLEIAETLAGSLTPDEIDAELAAAKAERIQRDQVNEA